MAILKVGMAVPGVVRLKMVSNVQIKRSERLLNALKLSDLLNVEMELLKRGKIVMMVMSMKVMDVQMHVFNVIDGSAVPSKGDQCA